MRREGTLKFIGVVRRSRSLPRSVSELDIFQEYCQGLHKLEDFSHIMVFYWLHLRDNQAHRSTVKVIPRRHHGAPEVGVFASRSPSRPNPIGFSVVELLEIESCKIFVKGLDAASRSPVIDIKPYIPRADSVPNARAPEWTLSGPRT